MSDPTSADRRATRHPGPATSLPQEGSGLQAGGELWSWGRRCCSM
jgi:hypothetical protein